MSDLKIELYTTGLLKEMQDDIKKEVTDRILNAIGEYNSKELEKLFSKKSDLNAT